MKTVRTVRELRDAVIEAKTQGKSIGLVPTMGALHAGHLSLVEKARKENDIVIVSVFVNPTQFNNPDDLAKYPRTEENDVRLLQEANADIAFIPSVHEVYGDSPDTRVFDLGKVAQVMEGAMRPGHFNGVAQIVSRLFEWAEPTRAYFGEKDFQQIAVIRRMADTSGYDKIQIVACPIVREADGLAMSSRNVRLTAEHRALAPAIHRLLTESVKLRATGAPIAEVKEYVTSRLDELPDVKVEYLSIVHPTTLEEVEDWNAHPHPVGCITVWFGDVRLIDNITY